MASQQLADAQSSSIGPVSPVIQADAEQYSRDPYPVTWDLQHPRATVKPTGDGRWRVVLWEAPGVVMSDHVHSGSVTILHQGDAARWAELIIGWERRVRQ